MYTCTCTCRMQVGVPEVVIHVHACRSACPRWLRCGALCLATAARTTTTGSGSGPRVPPPTLCWGAWAPSWCDVWWGVCIYYIPSGSDQSAGGVPALIPTQVHPPGPTLTTLTTLRPTTLTTPTVLTAPTRCGWGCDLARSRSSARGGNKASTFSGCTCAARTRS